MRPGKPQGEYRKQKKHRNKVRSPSGGIDRLRKGRSKRDEPAAITVAWGQ